MSGGSFNYLCYKDFDDLVNNSPFDDELERMATILDSSSPLAAAATREILAKVRETRRELFCFSMPEKLVDVWKAVEWCYSGDSGDEDINEAVAIYEKTVV